MDDARVIAAIVGAATALITSFITTLVTLRNQRKNFRMEQAKIDVSLEELEREHKLSYAAERVAHSLLNDEEWRLRSFSVLKRHLGGFSEEDLRRLLVGSGAIRFYTTEPQREMWGLLERNMDRLGAIELEVPPETRPLPTGEQLGR